MPSATEFQELREKVGLGLALVLWKGDLPPDFLASLTFDDWVEVYKDAPFDNDIRRQAWVHVVRLAYTFDEWCAVYKLAEDRNEKYVAWESMLKLATLEQLLVVYRNECPVGTKIRRQVFERIAIMACPCDYDG
jgi:hypothetical protein